MKALVRFVGMTLSLGLLSSISFAQVAGDYGSATTGNWGTTNANWLVFVSASDWSDATPAPGAPTTSTNVWIRPGHTVTMEASSKACKNLVVQTGATLLTSAAGNSLSVNGDAQIDGTFGSVTVGPTFQFNTSGRIFGSGTFYFSKIRANANSITMTVDMDVTGVGSSNFVNANGKTPVTFEVKAGRTVTLPTGGYISVSSSSSTAEPSPGLNFTINVYGTIIAPVTSTGGMNLANAAGFTTTLNVFSTGIVNTGRLTVVDTAHGTSIINLNSGGQITLTGPVSNNAGKATIAIDGTFDCGNSTSVAFGTATISSTGKLRLQSGTYPTGTVTLNSGSTVEYYGASPYILPASPTTYENLLINTAGGVALSAGTTVNSSLTLASGALSLGGNTLTLNGAVNTTGGSLNGGASAGIIVGGSGASTALPSVTLASLTLNRATGLTLGGNVSVTGTLTLTNGAITTGANTLSIASGGTVARTNGYVIGTLQKYLSTGSNVAVTYELGTANGYSPVNILFANVLSPGNFSGSIVAGDPSNLATSGIDAAKNVNEYWSFQNGAAFDTYSGTLNFASGDVDGGANPSNFVARAYNGNLWSPLTVGTTTGTSTQISGPSSSGGTIALGEPVSGTVTLSATAGTGGTISPSGDVVLGYATTQAFTITPTAGYHLDTLLVDGVKVDSSASYTFINPIVNHTIRAVFAVTQFQIIATAGSNGSITPSGTINMNTGGNQAFAIVPNTGYHVDSVIVDGVKVDSVASYTFSNVTVNHTIRTTFAINQYTITVTSGANGAVTPTGPVVLNYGVTQSFSIAPDAHYHVDTLFVDGVRVDSTTSYTFVAVSANHTIRAQFAIDQFAISATVTTGGTLTPSGTLNVGYGAIQSFAFSASVHYQLDSVIVDGAKVDSTSSYTFTNVTVSHTIRVTFKAVVMSIKSNGTGGGAWNTVSTWQGGFVPILSDTVTLLATDTVTVGGSMSCRTINVLAGGRLVLLANDSLTVTSPDSLSIITGTISNAGMIVVSGKLQFGNGAKYQHARNGGTIPTSKWGTGSTCEITGLTGNAPTNGNQNFYNVRWNCPGQTANLNMGWNGIVIGGNVEIDSTGNSRWQLCAPSSGTDSAHLVAATVTINGNIIQTGGQFSSNGTSNAFTSITINTLGNITVTGGNFSVSRGSQGNSGTTMWNVYGNFSLSNATSQNSNATGARFVFAKSGVQSLVLGVGNTLSALPIEVKGGTTLNIDTGVVSGSGIFMLDSAATLMTARPNGLNGNLATTGTVTLNRYANFVYDGVVAQTTGAMLPATINRLTINNAAGVTLSDTVAVADTLYLSAGKLTLAGNLLTVKGVVGSSSTKYVVTDAVGSLKFGSVGSAEVQFPVGTASSYAPLWITNAGTADAFSVGVVADAGAAPLGGRVKAKWNIAEGTAGGSNCTLKFGWMGTLEDAVFAADRAGNTGIFRLGTDTTAKGTGAYTTQFTSEPYTAARGGITSFGSFAVGKFSLITSVDNTDLVPTVFSLSQNYPNPFNPSTTIMYGLPQQSRVAVKIYSILGQEVRTLVDEVQNASFHRALWNGRDNYGMQVSTGVYFFRIFAQPLDGKTQPFTQVKKMLLMK